MNDNDQEDRLKRIVHIGHAAKEIAFQELIRNRKFENITVKDLRESAATIASSILNYHSQLKRKNSEEIQFITDEDAYENSFWRNQSLRSLDKNFKHPERK